MLRINKDFDPSIYTFCEIKGKAEKMLSQLTSLQKEVICKLQDQRKKLPTLVEDFTSHDNTADALYNLYLRSLYAFSYTVSQLVITGYSDLQDIINKTSEKDAYKEKNTFMLTLEKIAGIIQIMEESFSENTLIRLYLLKNQLGIIDILNVVKGGSFLDVLGTIRKAGITSDLIQHVIADEVPTVPNIVTLE